MDASLIQRNTLHKNSTVSAEQQHLREIDVVLPEESCSLVKCKMSTVSHAYVTFCPSVPFPVVTELTWPSKRELDRYADF